MATHKLSFSRLKTFFKNACEKLQSNMDASEYKENIIALFFLKRVNNQFEVQRDTRKKNLVEVRHMEEDGLIYKELEKQNAPEYEFFIPQAAGWNKLIRNSILHQTINSYLQKHNHQLLLAIKNLYSKYMLPLHALLMERKIETLLLNSFLIELDYV